MQITVTVDSDPDNLVKILGPGGNSTSAVLTAAANAINESSSDKSETSDKSKTVAQEIIKPETTKQRAPSKAKKDEVPRETSGAETPPEKIKQSSDEPDCGPGTRDEQKCKDIKGCHFTQDEECLPVSHPIASAEIKSNPLNELTRTKNYQQVMLKEKLNPTEAQEEKCEKDEDCGENRECNQETKECQVKKGEEYKPPELPQPKQTTPSILIL